MRKLIGLMLIATLISCQGKKSQGPSTTKDTTTVAISDVDDAYEVGSYENSVRGHKEEPMIFGNFTGRGIDTIYIDDDFDKNSLSKAQRKKYGFGLAAGGNADESELSYAVSNNPILPPVELFCPNELVFEGDVDGDGKDEWGYFYECSQSQWRLYRIYTFDVKSGTWKHLYYGRLLNTPEYVRASGVDIVEKGPKPGFIKINYGTWGTNLELRDTIVKPTYTPISKDAW